LKDIPCAALISAISELPLVCDRRLPGRFADVRGFRSSLEWLLVLSEVAVTLLREEEREVREVPSNHC
jgi:hypothetical protein